MRLPEPVSTAVRCTLDAALGGRQGREPGALREFHAAGAASELLPALLDRDVPACAGLSFRPLLRSQLVGDPSNRGNQCGNCSGFR